ncbi:hypothetical protein [Streptomyces azureus]|uniref:Uncharacterized protein n=1 Tax=Streptomyces azureus TaxID=146537 RepID=A0A0K8PX95_STRAJ|nr:hypothetical protein [Streptomyces azureus]GAP52378.1 predicted protein [Streptomyces azureus]
MSRHVTRRRHRQAAPPSDHASCGANLKPAQRVTVFALILLVVIVLVCSGQPVCDAVGLVMAAGAAAAQIGAWLNGQRLATGSPGGV